MSDFFSTGWSLFVAAASLLSMVFCLVLLAIAARRRVMADDNTTGHIWDVDLRELNNPLPRWWLWLFIGTVVFGFAYLYLYPGAGSRAGALGWSSAGQHAADRQAAVDKMATVYARYTAMSPDDLVKDKGAMAIGERLYINICSQCHGSDAKGSKGFPNLTLAGDARLAAGTHESIVKTITNGRQAVMPPLAAAVGDANDLHNLAQYVLSLSGSPHDSIAAASGKAKFAVCTACHGAEGKGNQVIGAPNLTDNVWLHGYGEEAIVSIVTKGKINVMPSQAQRLTPEQTYVLAAYVMNLPRSRTTAAP